MSNAVRINQMLSADDPVLLQYLEAFKLTSCNIGNGSNISGFMAFQ